MNVHAPALAQTHPLDEQASAFAGDVIGDLSQFPKRLSPKYFYDAAGCALFGAICELPEYYPTRTEAHIFDRYRHDIVAAVGTGSVIGAVPASCPRPKSRGNSVRASGFPSVAS